MRRFVLALLLLCSWSVKARAEGDSYEAAPGLIVVGRYVIFFNSKGPLSYNSMSPKEVPKDAVDLGPVRCSSCQRGVSIPIPVSAPGMGRTADISAAQGDGGYRKALENLQKERPELRGIYDVKVDVHQFSVLGIYRKLCVEVAGRGFK